MTRGQDRDVGSGEQRGFTSAGACVRDFWRAANRFSCGSTGRHRQLLILFFALQVY